MTGFTEEDIRPAQLMAQKKDCLEWDLKFLRDRSARFVCVVCPACGSEDKESLFEKHEIAYVRCRRCGTLFIDPRPSFALLHEFYEQSRNYAFWQEHIFPATEAIRRENIHKPRVQMLLDLVARHSLQASSVIEVGAGDGTFCEELLKANRFDKVIAIEPNPLLAQTCRNKGLETIQLPVEWVGPGVRADVVVAFEVIEHLFSPLEFLWDCWVQLLANGLLVVSCPNPQGFDILCLGSQSGAIQHEHLNYFTPQSIHTLMARAGFKVIEVSTPGKLDAGIVAEAAKRGDISLDEQPFLHHVLVEHRGELLEPFQRFLAENLQSSHMLCVAQKKDWPLL